MNTYFVFAMIAIGHFCFSLAIFWLGRWSGAKDIKKVIDTVIAEHIKNKIEELKKKHEMDNR